MKLEILLSVMENSFALKEIAQEMNIDSDMLIINQCDKLEYEELIIDKCKIRCYSFPERGLSRSRNEGLMRITGDIIVFADDGEKFVKNYRAEILNEFKMHPEADIIIFNEKTVGDTRQYYQNTKWRKIKRYNCLRYGSTRIAFRSEKVIKNNLFMNILLGAGSKYQNGEDSVFIFDCLKKGLKIYASTKCIATVDRSESTWFDGYTNEYYYNKGAVFYCLYGNFFRPYAAFFSIKHRTDGEIPPFKKYSLLKKGALEYKKSKKIEHRSN